jgi:membrane fusion protein (multidrug efflux system)
VLADSSVFPHAGKITFVNADYDVKTGTYLMRATFDNPDASLRPGQFVRVRISGAVRPKAILVPQEAVLQGAKGHFVVVVDRQDQAEMRPVEVGPWNGNDWFILSGLAAGDRVVTDGVVHLAPGAKVEIVKTLKPAPEASPDHVPAPTTGSTPPRNVPTPRPDLGVPGRIGGEPPRTGPKH